VKVSGFPGIATDYRGYTVQPWLNPYHENSLSLDPTTLPSEAEITITDSKVVPTAGAIIPVKFKTRVGAKAIITLLQPDSTKVPFGSVVRISSDSGNEGIVDNDGKVYMSGLPPEGNLTVIGKTQSLKCPYHLIKNDEAHGLNFFTAKCK
jgi:outer membrane usher protein